MDKETQREQHLDRPAKGADLSPRERPGVPMERAPRPLTPTAHWDEPPRMAASPGLTRRKELRAMTHVYGTAQPPRGVSGMLRRLAYSIPETRARRWMLLIFADRVDVLGHRLARLVRVAAVGTAGLAALALASRALRR